ncbi:MAG: ATP-binding cassette domain-containing protein [Longimicrobiales bacterium]|nr:ATP-binding cassette domain-containing protein [Longimicrobiales bacterium]
MKSVVAENLVRRYGSIEAVADVSFEVEEGEIFAFLGPNGAGKTTTINILCTLLTPTAGRASVVGHDVVTERQEVRRSIGVVFQEPTLDEQLTAEQNLRFHGYAYGVPRKILEERMRDLLEMLELWERRGDRVKTYSGGMKRRLEIARGLLHRPRVLFLDEPTLGLDPQTRRRIWEYVVGLRDREGVTVFFTTHYMDEAEHSDRIAIIDHGRIVALDTPDRLKDRVGGDIVTLTTDDDDAAIRELREGWELDPRRTDGAISFPVSRGREWLPEFVKEFSQRIVSIGVHRPTLDDVFIEITGRAMREENEKPADGGRRRGRPRGRRGGPRGRQKEPRR